MRRRALLMGGKKSAPFITVWKTDNTDADSTAANQIRLPFNVAIGIPYKLKIDWGDGTIVNVPAGTTGNNPLLSHTYSTSGIYEVKMYGHINTWQWTSGYTTDNKKLIEIKQWGGFKPLNRDGLFYLCSNLNGLNISDVLDLSSATSMRFTFQGNTSLTYLKNVENWDVSSVTTNGLERMFHTSRFNQDISSWRFPLATSLEGFFNSNTQFNQDIAEWEVQNITDMRSMFSGASAFVQDISMWTFNINVNLANFMASKSNYPPSFYDALLINWAARFIGSGRSASKTLGMGTNKYTSAGATARAALVSDGWTITDGGLV